MPRAVQHAVPHSLSLQEARSLLRDAIARYSDRFPAFVPRAHWRDEDHLDVSFTAKGLELHGSVAITSQAWVLQLDVPLLLRPFRSVAVARIDREAARLLAELKTGSAG